MSNDRFVVDLNRNPNAANEMDENVLRGFKKSVRNNQPRLAMEYLIHVLDVLINDDEEKAKSEPDPKPIRKTAPVAKAEPKTDDSGSK